jgi:hypothetical protein
MIIMRSTRRGFRETYDSIPQLVQSSRPGGINYVAFFFFALSVVCFADLTSLAVF